MSLLSLRHRLIPFVGAIVALAVAAHCSAGILPVKRGQTSVDAGKLPFACFTIATEGANYPLETVTVQNVATHKEYTARMTKFFGNDHPDYPTALVGWNRAVSMVVLQLKPGRYRLKAIEFTPSTRGQIVASANVELPPVDQYTFMVKPAAVNYVGCLVIAAGWGWGPARYLSPGQHVSDQMPAAFKIERTEKRDEKWAADAIPCMAALPVLESPFGEP